MSFGETRSGSPGFCGRIFATEVRRRHRESPNFGANICQPVPGISCEGLSQKSLDGVIAWSEATWQFRLLSTESELASPKKRWQ